MGQLMIEAQQSETPQQASTPLNQPMDANQQSPPLRAWPGYGIF